MSFSHSLGNDWKGNSGEFIVEQFLRRLGFKVFRFGVERFLWKLVDGDNLNNSNVKTVIGASPDFIAVDKDNNVFSIDAKLWLSLDTDWITNKAKRYKEHFSPETIIVFVTGEKQCPFKACKVGNYHDLSDLKDLKEILNIKKTEKNKEIIEEVENLAVSIYNIHKDFDSQNKNNEGLGERERVF